MKRMSKHTKKIKNKYLKLYKYMVLQLLNSDVVA